MFQLRCPIKTSPAEFYVSKDSSVGGVFFSNYNCTHLSFVDMGVHLR